MAMRVNPSKNTIARRDAAMQRMLASLDRGAYGKPRYQREHARYLQEAALIPQLRVRIASVNLGSGAIATIADVVQAKMQQAGEAEQPKKQPKAREVKLPVFHRTMVVMPDEAQQLCHEFGRLVKDALTNSRQYAEELFKAGAMDEEELRWAKDNNEVWLHDIIETMSDRLQQLVVGMGLGFRHPTIDCVMVGPQAVSALFTKLVM